jgi:hypothetical protein
LVNHEEHEAQLTTTNTKRTKEKQGMGEPDSSALVSDDEAADTIFKEAYVEVEQETSLEI